jgi:murein L,D-transpeptidase YafK
VRRFGHGRAAILGAMLVLGGCWNPLDRFRPVSVNVPQVVTAVDDDERAPWADPERYAIVVRKACRTLDVYHYGRRVRSFEAVFGLNGSGSKLFEGDLRTPSGLYMIVDKRRHARWRHFLLLDYPNVHDLDRYRIAMAEGDIPREGSYYAGIGGAVGIHGTHDPGLNRRNVDWTLGCISLQNRDIDDLAALVPIGTLVLIED